MVAERAGVSVATVSYVLNNTRYVSPKLRDRINKAIEELNYHPDMIARSMVKKESRMLTIIANNLSNSMYGEIIMEFEKAAMAKGYFTNICSGYLNLQQYLGMIIARRIDGLYFASVPRKVQQADIDQLLGNGIRVACGNYLLPDEKRVSRIDMDYDDGLRQVVMHLKALRHDNIAYVNGFSRDDASDLRYRAFLRAMDEFYPGKQVHTVFGSGPDQMTEVEGYPLAMELLKTWPDTTAIVCTSDLLAYGVINAVRESGRRIPEDVSIVGVEDLNTSRFINPPLTTLTFNRTQFSETIVNLLTREGAPGSELIPMRLVVRSSTGPSRASC